MKDFTIICFPVQTPLSGKILQTVDQNDLIQSDCGIL